MTKEQIQNELLDALTERDRLADSYQSHLIASVNAEHSFTLAHATNMLKAEGKNADQREAFVISAIAPQRLDYKLAEASAKGVREILNAKADKINAFQSLLRAEMQEADLLRFNGRSGGGA